VTTVPNRTAKADTGTTPHPEIGEKVGKLME